MNCEHCQNLLLDHLYGLLDRAEAAQVDAHLAECPACAAARAETARLQGLIARAAKGTFPNTRFEAPATKAAPALATPAHTARGRDGTRGWSVAAVASWAVAAAVLLAIPGTVVPVLNAFHKADEAAAAATAARQEADTAARAVAEVRLARDARLTDAEVKLAAAEQTRVALLDRWLAEQKAVAQAAVGQKLTVDVLKPVTVQPGAPNDFLVVVRDERDGSARRARLVAEVRASDAVLFAQPLDHEKRGSQHPIRLPASVWAKLKPDAELTLVVAEVDEKTQARTPVQEVRLAGPVFTTLLVTDKPVYRPGERLFFRSLTLDRVTLKPPAHEQALRFDLVAGTGPSPRAAPLATATGTTGLVRVGEAGGKVEPVRAADGRPVRGVGCGEFVLPANLPDGDYTLVLRELPTAGGPAAVPAPVARTVKVRAGAQETFAKQIGYTGASFVSGDVVEAWAELRFHDRPVAGADVAGAVVEADGVPVPHVEVTPKTDALGRANLRFALPGEVLNGDVRVKVTFRSAEGVETVADRVPVIGRRLHVEFFPESGDALVAGVPCKVYVRATTPAGRPVDISGVVTDGRQTLATVKTLRDDAERGANRGLASFTFTPQAGVRAWLKLDAPNGVYAPLMPDAPVKVAEVAGLGGAAAVARHTGFPLPEPQLDGVVMSVPDAVTAPGQPIAVHLYSVGQPRALVVGAYVRGRLADTQKVLAEAGRLTEVKLMAGADPRGGVVRVTAFEEVDAKGDPDRPDLKPVAERLVFRRPGEVLNLVLAVAPAGPQAPGTPVTCAVTATDESGKPAAAVLWAAAVNTGTAPGARDRALPTHFLLAGDVKNPEDLEYADFLLTDHPKAREALDLVLGTQGWRRFAEQYASPLAAGKGGPQANPADATAAGRELNRLMVQNGQHLVQAEPGPAREARRLADTYAPLYDTAVQAVAKARAALDEARARATRPDDLRAARAAEATARRAATEQEQRADAAREPVRRFRAGVWFGAAGFAGLALLCGGVALVRPRTRVPLGFSTLGSFGLTAFLAVAAGWGAEAKGDLAGAAPAAAGEKAPVPREVAPPPRLKAAADRDAAKSGPVADAKGEGFPKVAGFGAAGFGGGGFGGAGAAAPLGPGVPPRGLVKDLPPPAPAFAPGMRLTEPKVAQAAGAFGGGLGGGPALPAPPPPPKPGGLSMKAYGDTGWVPARPLEVTAHDLARSGPSDPYFMGQALRFNYEDRAAALKRATDEANRFATERQRKLAEALDAQYGRRAAVVTAPALENAGATQTYNNVQLSPEKIEALALRQIRGSVTALPPLVVREYARPRPAAPDLPDAAPDTILWQPLVVLPADGRAVLNFTLGDAPGGYRVLVAGHTADGRLGEARAVIAVQPSAPRTTAPTVTGPTGGSVPQGVPTAPGPRP